MSDFIKISDFKSLNYPEKINFLQDDFFKIIINLNDKEVNSYLREIIFDQHENNFIKKLSIEIFTELVLANKLKSRQGLSLLLDDWKSNNETFVELQRLKDLYLYYDLESEEIESVYISGLENSDAEIVSQSLMNLGLIYFQKALANLNEKELQISLYKAKDYFKESKQIIENQINSKFYFKVTEILILIWNFNWTNVDKNLKELANLLFEKEVFMFNPKNENFEFCFYKILVNLQKIRNQKPREWYDFKSEIENIHCLFLEIQNMNLINRLNEKSVVKSLSEVLKYKFIEPHFSLNFNSEVYRISQKLKQLDENTNLYEFLFYLKNLILNSDKKKVEHELLTNKLKEIFPQTSMTNIQSLVIESKNPIDYLNAVESLLKKSNKNLIDSLIYSCSKLQGEKRYWGDKADENDRNRFIANLLEARGFNTKDQPQWSKSAEGKKSGEIDIFVNEIDGLPKSIIEGLNLDSLKSNYLIEHLDKIFIYDTTGLENNFILVYSTAIKFNNLWLNYKKFIDKYKSNYEMLSFSEIFDYKFSDIKVAVSVHKRNGKETNLYHVMINMSQR